MCQIASSSRARDRGRSSRSIGMGSRGKGTQKSSKTANNYQ